MVPVVEFVTARSVALVGAGGGLLLPVEPPEEPPPPPQAQTQVSSAPRQARSVGRTTSATASKPSLTSAAC